MDFNSLEIEASRYEQQLRKHRRALHRIPELGYEEIKTHEYLMRHLEKLAPDDLRVFAQTGIRAVFRGDGTGRVIAFPFGYRRAADSGSDGLYICVGAFRQNARLRA